MKKMWLTLLPVMALICVFPFSGNAASRYYWQKQCLKLMEKNPAKITIYYNLGKLKYNNSLSSAQIKARASNNLNGEITYMGLTLLNLYNKISVYDSSPLELGDGYFCTYPTEITMEVGYENPTVYLANSMDKNSCVYKKTLRHEQQHVDISYIFIMSYIEALKKQLPEIVRNTGPIFSVSKTPDKKLFYIYNEQTKAIFDEYFEVRQKRSALMDSPENYERESKLCR